MLNTLELEKKAQRLWPKILGSALSGEESFPWEVSLGTPRGQDLSERFEESAKWLKHMRAYASEHGLLLRETRITHRQLGEQMIPTHIVLDTMDAYLRWQGKTGLFQRWFSEAKATWNEFLALRPWLLRNVLIVERYLDDWCAVRSTLRRFIKGDIAGRFLRELDIPAVDSKFVERHRLLLAELLSLVLEPGSYDNSIYPGTTARFCQRFGLVSDHTLIRFRCLDQRLLTETGGFADLSVPLAALCQWKSSAHTIFITENKTNGLSFPFCQNSLIMFGLGGAVDLLRDVHWLKDKELLYWGDIDSHGFAILARLRRYFPDVRSFLMDEETFLLAKDFWVKEAKPYEGDLDASLLTDAERGLFDRIRSNFYGANLRLEQERIPFGQLLAKLALRRPAGQ